jgi:hypothetical protein
MFTVPPELFEAAIFSSDAATVPPLPIVREPLPLEPMVSDSLLLQVEPGPVTSTLLFEDVAASPIVPLALITLPPRVTVRILFCDRTLPIVTLPELLKVDPLPATNTLFLNAIFPEGP